MNQTISNLNGQLADQLGKIRAAQPHVLRGGALLKMAASALELAKADSHSALLEAKAECQSLDPKGHVAQTLDELSAKLLASSRKAEPLAKAMEEAPMTWSMRLAYEAGEIQDFLTNSLPEVVGYIDEQAQVTLGGR